jgi:hypothetical protein
VHPKSLITVALTLAAIAAPAAQASNPLGHPGGPVSVGIVPAKAGSASFRALAGGPGSVGLVEARPSSSSSYFRHDFGPGGVGLIQAATPSSSYLRHDFGPGGVGLIQAATPSTGTGFAWDDAAIGAGFTAGLGLIAAGAWLATRRRATLAHSSS